MNSPTPILGSSAMGLLSIGSGALMLVFPDRMARAYGLPHSNILVRSLGLRDVLLGAALLKPKQRTWGNLARAFSDLVDLGLVINQARQQHGGLSAALGRAAGAMLSATIALWLSQQLPRHAQA